MFIVWTYFWLVCVHLFSLALRFLTRLQEARQDTG